MRTLPVYLAELITYFMFAGLGITLLLCSQKKRKEKAKNEEEPIRYVEKESNVSIRKRNDKMTRTQTSQLMRQISNDLVKPVKIIDVKLDKTQSTTSVADSGLVQYCNVDLENTTAVSSGSRDSTYKLASVSEYYGSNEIITKKETNAHERRNMIKTAKRRAMQKKQEDILKPEIMNSERDDTMRGITSLKNETTLYNKSRIMSGSGANVVKELKKDERSSELYAQPRRVKSKE